MFVKSKFDHVTITSSSTRMVVMQYQCNFFPWLLISSIFIVINAHENYDNPNKPPHQDIDPVIEFPDNDPDYVPGDFDREHMSVEELGHYLNHALVKNMAHNNLLTSEIMRQMRESIRDGSYIGKGPKKKKEEKG